MREAFQNALKGRHHLSSTEVCPGVYNSPFAAVTGGQSSVGGKTLEEHLRFLHHEVR